MELKNYKIVIAIIVISVFIFTPIYSVKALAAFLFYLKEFVLDLIARLIARGVFSLLNNSIINKVLSLGRLAGTPALVQDWRDFLQDGQYRGEAIFRSMLATTPVCNYIREPINTIFNIQPGSAITGVTGGLNRLYDLQTFGLRNACSGSIISSPAQYNAFRSDFSKGGWTAWDQLIKPQNNLYGVFNDAANELSKQREFEEGTDDKEAQSGSGYTSRRKPGSSGACTSQGMQTGQCYILGVLVTPGSLFDKTIAQTLNSQIDWPVSCDELSECLALAAASSLAFLSERLTNLTTGSLVGGESAPTGSDKTEADSGLGRARSICIDDCVAERCPPPLEECQDTDGDGIPDDNGNCRMPGEPDPRDACVSACEAQCNSAPSSP